MTFHTARNCLILAIGLLLSACATNYGKIPHARYASDPRCVTDPASGGAALSGEALFLVTSRLPDCRADLLALTNFRSQQIRYGRFDQPRPGVGKSQPKMIVPLSFQGEER